MAGDPFKYFRIEAREIVEQLGSGALELERGTAPEQVVARLLRLAHTLKGAARVVKQREIADLAHELEGALGPHREARPEPVPAETIERVLKMVDRIGELVAALGAQVEPGALHRAPAEPGLAIEDGFRTLRADVGEMDALLDGIAEVSVQLAPLRQAIGQLERARRLGELLGDQLAVRAGRASPAIDAGRARSLAAELRLLIETLERDLAVGVGQVDREVHQVREAAERLRLLPATLMASVLERTARDAAQAVGARVAFELIGGDVRLDADVLAIIQPALVQAVRNAVAHGIEREAERTAVGKPGTGTVSIEVSRRGNRVAFICRDDGRGVDVEAVRRAAQRKGIAATDAQHLPADELLRLVLRGGITTTGTVTEVSGRGIGLDVVREAAHRLGGEVAVRTEPNKGTALELIVPVSMASLEALVVEAGTQTAAIPLDAVRQAVRVPPGGLAQTPTGSSIVFQGKVIPFRQLARSLRSTETRSVAQAWSAVVVAGEAGLAAIGVDRLRGTETIVVRPLPELAPADPVISGASLDADGNPQLVLDPEALVLDAHQDGGRESVTAPVRRPILVVDDSLTTRMLEQSILESAGYTVHVASSGEEGLDKARQTRYALFLVDVEMPGMDGFTFIENTRADPDLRDTPAILVTSRGSPEDRQRGTQAGARGYIVKSEFDQGVLLERIRALIGAR